MAPTEAEKAFAERISAALNVALRYGGIDGDHHRAWVIDQMVRILRVDEAGYQDFVRRYSDGEDGPNTYEWYPGIAP